MSDLFRSTGLAPVENTVPLARLGSPFHHPLDRGGPGTGRDGLPNAVVSPPITARRGQAPVVVEQIKLLIRAGFMVSLLFAASGCHQTATSSENAGHRLEAAEHSDEEEAPLTAADVPMPANYAEAVERLCEYRDAIREAVTSGQPEKAHRPLDETNIALERLPALARSSGVPRRDWETVVVAGDDLGEALGAIHETIDANQLPDYSLHAKDIDDALARLRKVAEQHENAPNRK